jgi:hypothetical protein
MVVPECLKPYRPPCSLNSKQKPLPLARQGEGACCPTLDDGLKRVGSVEDATEGERQSYWIVARLLAPAMPLSFLLSPALKQQDG